MVIGYYDDTKDRFIEKCAVPKIKERTAYQVGEKIYKTKKAASRKVAWNWILTKYKTVSGVDDIRFIKRVLDMECDCGENENTEYGIQYGHEYCPLHNRYYGYFARLHKRASQAILKSWDAAA